MRRSIKHFLLLATAVSAALTLRPVNQGEEFQFLPIAAAATSHNNTGSYAKVHRRSFKTVPRKDYYYTPSKEAHQLARLQSAHSRSWFELVPDGQAAAPLVILFHGAGRDGLSMIDMWKELATNEDLILLAPNARGRSWQASDFTLESLDNMLLNIERERPIDHSKIFIFGHSNGGGFATLLLNRFDGPWVAGATHAGFASANNIIASSNAKPFRIYLGDQDHIFAEARAEETARTIARSGHAVTLQMIANHTHWYYDIGPQIAKDAWRWFEALDQ